MVVESILEFIQTNQRTIIYISIPFTCGFVGWVTNVLALKMTFYPLKFIGLFEPYLGWQGIIPRKANKMSSKTVDLLSGRVIKIEELFDSADPDKMSKQIAPPIEHATSELIEDIGSSTNPLIWKFVPDFIKSELKKKARTLIPGIIRNILVDLKLNLLELFNLKKHMMDNLTGNNVIYLVRLFQKAGGPEFKFIEISGLYFGFLFGLVQLSVYYFYDQAWTLPFVGLIVGYATNWLALKMIFRPLHEKTYWGFKYQGLFLKRQKEVSEEYAHFIVKHVLSARKILEAILYGDQSEKLTRMSRQHITRTLAETEDFAKPIAAYLIGEMEYEKLKEYILEKILRILPEATMRAEPYLEDAMDLENILAARLSELSPEEFESILRTAFQEDEIILILVGAGLGALIGLLQAFLF